MKRGSLVIGSSTLNIHFFNLLNNLEHTLQIFKHKSLRVESKKLQHHHKIVEKIFVAKSAPKIIVHKKRQQLVKATA
jgi:hypothetical protein